MREKVLLAQSTRVLGLNYLKNGTGNINVSSRMVNEKSKAIQVNSRKPCNQGDKQRRNVKAKLNDKNKSYRLQD